MSEALPLHLRNPQPFVDGIASHLLDSRNPYQIKYSDNLRQFASTVLPYLYLGFCKWRFDVTKEGNEEVRNAVKPREHSLSAIINLQSIGRFLLANPPYTYPDVDLRINYANYPTEIRGHKIPQTAQMVNAVLAAWNEMMFLSTSWIQVSAQTPFIIDLSTHSPLAVAHLPKTITMMGYVLVRLMDSFYAPDKQGALWSKALYAHLFDKYEAMCDLLLKESIDAILIGRDDKFIKGNILDIGCGTGLLKEWINQWGMNDYINLFGIDICEEMLAKAQSRGEKSIVGNVAEMTPTEICRIFQVDQFDHVVASYVDNWLTSDERRKIALTVSELLPAGGSYRFNVYNVESGWDKQYKELMLSAGFSHVICFEKTLTARDGTRTAGFVFAYK